MAGATCAYLPRYLHTWKVHRWSVANSPLRLGKGKGFLVLSCSRLQPNREIAGKAKTTKDYESGRHGEAGPANISFSRSNVGFFSSPSLSFSIFFTLHLLSNHNIIIRFISSLLLRRRQHQYPTLLGRDLVSATLSIIFHQRNSSPNSSVSLRPPRQPCRPSPRPLRLELATS